MEESTGGQPLPKDDPATDKPQPPPAWESIDGIVASGQPPPAQSSATEPVKTDPIADPSPPESTPVQGKSNTLPPPAKRAHWLVYFYILAILIVAAAAGLYSWKHHKPSSVRVSSAAKKTTATATTYSGWRTFVDDKRAFEIKFPPNWVEAGHSSNGLVSSTPVDVYGNVFYPSGTVSANPQFTVFAYNGSDPKQIIDQFYGSGSYTPQAETISGYQAYYYSINESGQVTDVYVVYSNGIGVLFYFPLSQTGSGAYNYSSYLPLFKQMVDSISFSVPVSAATFADYFSTGTDTTYLKLTQLGIELPENATLSGMYYVYSGNAAYLYLPALDRLAHQQAPSACAAGPATSASAAPGYQPIGAISKGYAGPDNQLNIATITGQTYDLAGADGGCSDFQSIANALNTDMLNLTESLNQARSINP